MHARSDKSRRTAWQQTPAGLRGLFWVALIVGCGVIGLSIYTLLELASFRPI